VSAERLIGALLQGALGGRRKRSRGALRYLTGGRGSLVNASTLMTAAGLAWGAYEAATRNRGIAGSGPLPPQPAPPLPGSGPLPPLPGAPMQRSAASAAPPLPGSAEPPADLLRLVRLTISAARADGSLSPEEQEAIVAHARDVGAEQLVDYEVRNPRPLSDIAAGVTAPKAREEMYAMAFAVVRADETVTGAERIYLAQLAHALGLDPATTARIEQEAAARIDAAGKGAE
jgi:uncharacterized membrane protein YebE (DUF533 family)